jgi:AmmeMemoRadiSam system protein B
MRAMLEGMETPLRPAELMGRWYPATAEECDRLLGAPQRSPELAHVVGAIVPHAGWVYSGKVAFEALSGLQASLPDAELVVIFGGHLRPRDRPRVFLDGAWQTPYGPLPVASALAHEVAMALRECDTESAEDYADDNAVEVLVPMVRRLWPHAQALMIGVPPTDGAGHVGKEVVALAQARGFTRIAVIGSTDLTHYGPNYAFSPAGRGPGGLEWVKTKNDPEVIAKMEALDARQTLWVAQRSRNACCPGAVAAAMVAARKLGAERGVVTRYTTSFDEHPSDPYPMSFVGYVGLLLGK